MKKPVINEPKGWIKLWRKSMLNELYWAEPFDKWHAWIDLLTMALSSDNDDCKRGTFYISLETLKTRWSWNSRHKVRDFLGHLEGQNMIRVSGHKGRGCQTLITIVNFDVYQKQKGHLKTESRDILREQEKKYLYKKEETSSTLKGVERGSLEDDSDEYLSASEMLARERMRNGTDNV